jgi:hypothetical protein
MMPVSTPEQVVETYGGDKEHFFHILEHLIVPSITSAGFEVLLPTVNGSVVIQSEIIQRLCSADMAVADMTSLNANVFFEMGVRTAINKPIAFIKDEKTQTLPFDASMMHCLTYSSRVAAWQVEEQISIIAEHISDSFKKSNGYNLMWSTFGAGISAEQKDRVETAKELQSLKAEIQMMRVQQMPVKRSQHPSARAKSSGYDVFLVLERIASDAGYFIDYNDSSLYGIDIRMPKGRSMNKTVKGHLSAVAKEYGYKLTFTDRR